VKFAFIHAEKAFFPIAAMCRLFEVSRQGYYAFANRPPSKRVVLEVELCQQIKEVFAESGGIYGSPRVWEELQRRGYKVGKHRVERAMRGMGVTPNLRQQPPRIRGTTHVVARNVLARDFKARRPNERWVTDITFVWTAKGWAYVAIILDLFSRAIVGWNVSMSYNTELVLGALNKAVLKRRPEVGLLHHSDQGCQYTSFEYQERLRELGITVSMSRKGNCWDNAVAESFFATLKTELIHRRKWTDLGELCAELFTYIEVFYNRRRLHSSLDYKTPAEVEAAFVAEAA
jgi:putative transposase